MPKKIKITESQLKQIVKEMMDVSSDSEHYKTRKRKVEIPFDELSMMGSLAKRFCEDKMANPDCKRIDSLYWEYGLINESEEVNELQYNTSKDFSLYSKYPCLAKTALKNNWQRWDDNGDGKIDRVIVPSGAGGAWKFYYPDGSLVFDNGDGLKNPQKKSKYSCKGDEVIDTFLKNPPGKVYSDPKNPFVKSPNGVLIIPWYTKDGGGGQWIANLQKVLISRGFLRIAKPTGYMGNMTKQAVHDAVKKYNPGAETNQITGITKDFYNQMVNLKPGQ